MEGIFARRLRLLVMGSLVLGWVAFAAQELEARAQAGSQRYPRWGNSDGTLNCVSGCGPTELCC